MLNAKSESGDHQVRIPKKLIEVTLPLNDINAACVREKAIRHGHPSTLHLWWARRPLAAARAVIFAQMVDDPSEHPESYPTEADQERERERLVDVIRKLVLWESTTDDDVLGEARAELQRSWRMTCQENQGHERAAELFDPEKLPAFYDPFAGGGALPLEAQRLGLKSYASDLNPVAVLLNKAMIEIPYKFVGKPPVNPKVRADQARWSRLWCGTQGMAQDVRYYGDWMRDEAEKRIGHLYPKISVTPEMVLKRPDLQKYLGKQLTVIAWLWARTVKSPNPAFASVEVPLTSTFMLSTRDAKEAYVEPIIENETYRFVTRVGKPKDAEAAKTGTKLARGANFRCVLSGVPIEPNYIYSEAKAGRMGARLMAIVAEGERGRIYLSATPEQCAIVESTGRPAWRSEVAIADNPRWFSPPLYGLTTYGELFTERQTVALTTFSDLVEEARIRVEQAAIDAGLPDDDVPLVSGGSGAKAYAEAVAVYLGLSVARLANRNSSISFWDNTSQKVQQAFGRQALPMTWDFCEANPFSGSSGNWLGQIEFPIKFLEMSAPSTMGSAFQKDAQTQTMAEGKLISTDPPYYDNIGYADLSDFFYVWQRRTLRSIFPDLFATVAVPRAEELVATPYRHGGKENAERFFLEGMTAAMRRLAEQSHPAFPLTIYYAFKQSTTDRNGETSRTGWESFLEAVCAAGLSISGTWPIRTELTGNLKRNVGALASSIILVCRPRSLGAPITTMRAFLSDLKAELPRAVAHLQRGNIAPVDLAQSAIGPGMGVFTRYAKVVDSEGNALSVGEALRLINDVLDEVLAHQEGDFDAESRFAIAWFEQVGFSEGEFGVADVLARAKNTAVTALVHAGIAKSRGNKMRLLVPDEFAAGWDPGTNPTVWAITHHLVRELNAGGETAAATLLAKLGSRGEIARELAYRLYTVSERKKLASEAVSYNALVQSWPEIVRLSRSAPKNLDQTELFGNQ